MFSSESSTICSSASDARVGTPGDVMRDEELGNRCGICLEWTPASRRLEDVIREDGLPVKVQQSHKIHVHVHTVRWYMYVLNTELALNYSTCSASARDSTLQ